MHLLQFELSLAFMYVVIGHVNGWLITCKRSDVSSLHTSSTALFHTTGSLKCLKKYEYKVVQNRRDVIQSVSATIGILCGNPFAALADEGNDESVIITATGDIKQLFREGQAYEFQGNMAAAQRIYSKVTKITPRFVYGWSSLGNTQVAIGLLDDAEKSYSTSIDLCRENNRQAEEKFGIKKCDDLYNLLLNRGVVRLNNNMPREALKDLELSSSLRARPDAIILQNLARAKELNGYFESAERDYALAISMTSNEVAPFWLRSAMVQFQIGDKFGAFDLLRRVENRFPEAPEVRAAVASMLYAKGDTNNSRKYLLQIPDEQRRMYTDEEFLKNKLNWPPSMIDNMIGAAKLLATQ